jgi:hypothetical protein
MTASASLSVTALDPVSPRCPHNETSEMHFLRILSLASSVLGASFASAAPANLGEHWAFQSPVRPAIPTSTDREPPNPIDAFIEAACRERDLKASPEASRRVLIRRVSLVLRGLPPSAEETAAFVSDNAPDAYSRLVDRILASRHYGERWARHWLDVARFAESEGYAENTDWPNMWRYRDYVVKSFNEDKPYSRFILEQLAGDELPEYRDEHIVATGFLSTARISGDEGSNIRQFNDLYVDMVNATGSALLGLTMGCAQCHDHKFDPLTLRDYYRLQAFFLQGLPGHVVLKGDGGAPSGDDELHKTSRELRQLVNHVRKYVLAEGYDLEPEPLRSVLHKREGERTVEEEALYRAARGRLNIRTAGCNAFRIKKEDTEKLNALRGKVRDLSANAPSAWAFYSPITSPHDLGLLPMTANFPLVHNENVLRATRAYMYQRGDPYKPAETVKPGFPAVFGSTPTSEVLEKTPRTALAQWLTRPDHPLTARVWVNRIWHYLLGRGLVSTPGNFGLRGARPSHPELLDWLAVELMENGWSTKHIQRLIVTSRTFRQSGDFDEHDAAIDPDNRYLWRWQRRRLEGEAIRDLVLNASGQLRPRYGGPSAAPGQDDRSRSLYLFQKRDNPPSMLALFDGPTAMSQSCAARSVSTSPLQPLYLLNSAFLVEESRALAERIRAAAGDDMEKQIQVAFDLTLQRQPDNLERDQARAFLSQKDEKPLPAIVDVDVPAAARQLVDGDSVTRWGDRRVGANTLPDDLGQTVRSRIPTFVDDPKEGIHGRPVIRFAGGPFGQSDHFLEAPDSDEFDMTTAYTVVVVVRFNGEGQRNQTVYLKGRNGDQDIAGYALYRHASGHLIVGQNIAGAWGDRLKSSKPIEFGVPIVVVTRFDGQKLELEIHGKDGLICRDGTPLPGAIDPGNAGRFALGGYTDAFSDDGERMNGDVGEFLLFRSALADAQRDELTESLGEKWLRGTTDGVTATRRVDAFVETVAEALSLWLRADSDVEPEAPRATILRNDPAAPFSLHVRSGPDLAGYTDHRPGADHSTVSYHFDEAVEVADIEAIVHTAGITEIEGFVGDDVKTLTSIGRASSGTAGRNSPYGVDRSSQVFGFDQAQRRSGRIFRFVVRESVQADGFSNYQAYPRASDGRRFPALPELDPTAVVPETDLTLFCQTLMNLNEFLYVE